MTGSVTTLAVIREQRRGERRVALVPAEIPKLTRRRPPGRRRERAPDEHRASPTRTTPAWTASGSWHGARTPSTPPDIVVAVSPPTADEVEPCPSSSTLVSFLPPVANVDAIALLRDRQVTAFSFDLVPRTSRAQAMDALSSQASLAGYQAAMRGGRTARPGLAR